MQIVGVSKARSASRLWRSGRVGIFCLRFQRVSRWLYGGRCRLASAFSRVASRRGEPGYGILQGGVFGFRLGSRRILSLILPNSWAIVRLSEKPRSRRAAAFRCRTAIKMGIFAADLLLRKPAPLQAQPGIVDRGIRSRAPTRSGTEQIGPKRNRLYQR